MALREKWDKIFLPNIDVDAFEVAVNSISELFISSVRSSYSHPDLLLITTPLFQITPVLDTGLSLSEPLQLYKGYNAI